MSRRRRRGGRGRWRGDRLSHPEDPRPPRQDGERPLPSGEHAKRGFFRRTPGRKEIYLLPTTFTLLNMFFGFAAVVGAMKGHLAQAAGFLLLANICDGLDGRFARMMGATSRMGKELDSLADVVSFGVAPGVLVWQWAFVAQPSGLARLGWLVGFVFLAAAALRLARFNVDDESRPHFLGLPAPSASAVLAATVFFHPSTPTHHLAPLALLLGMLALAALMVSRIPFVGLKNLDTRSPRSYVYILPVVLFIVLLAYSSKHAFLIVAYLYVLGNLMRAAKRRMFTEPAPATPSAPPSPRESRPPSEGGGGTAGGAFQPNRY